ncbi:glucose-6-phosphate exchanger SLC37A4-like [Diadema setosum]|uniref:glucose-6-phosphate exchanger SLC37A4-like n=1 Tax=Diadema setosum TaxID=31175 RepID=UPI003B3B951A
MRTVYQQWRLINVCVLFVGYGLYYLNRKSFIYLMPEIIADKGLENNELGAVASSLSLSYSISKFVGGVLSDHVSPRFMFPLGLFATGVLALQQSVASSVSGFVSASFLIGLAQGCGWPGVSKVLKQWYLPSEIGLSWCVVSSASNLAGTLGPLGLTILAQSFGWRASVQFCASGAVIVATAAGFMLRSSPEDVGLPPLQPHPGVRSSGQSSDRESTPQSSSALANLWAIVSSPALWVISLLFLITNFLIHGVSDWGQLFLIQEKGLSPTTGSSFTSAYSLGAIVGSITSGFITDNLVARVSRRSRGTPRYPWLLLMVAINLLFIYLLRNYIHASSYQEVILIVGLFLGVSQYSCVTLYGIITIESAPTHLSGTAHAFAALAANVGAILAGLPLTYISERFSWTHALYIMELVSFLSLAVMLLTRRMRMQIGYQSVSRTSRADNG